MSNLIIYNWMPCSTTVLLNDFNEPTDIPGNPIPPSSADGDSPYYPASIVIPRDLTVAYGRKEWGRTNSLVIHWKEIQGSLSFTDIKDPPGAQPSADLLLWVFPNRVVFSQVNLKPTEVYPDSQQNSP